MIALLATRRERAVDLVVRLERERTNWIGLYIEWSALGLEPEARIALENLRAVRRHLRRALRMARLWLWFKKA